MWLFFDFNALVGNLRDILFIAECGKQRVISIKVIREMDGNGK